MLFYFTSTSPEVVSFKNQMGNLILRSDPFLFAHVSTSDWLFRSSALIRLQNPSYPIFGSDAVFTDLKLSWS